MKERFGKRMELFIIILVLLAIIAVSNVINHFIPVIPVPLIQIVLGIAVAILPLGIHIELEPELFFLLFVAPILFNDGKMIPKSELWKLKVPVLLLALGLVFATVIAEGYLIYWFIPGIPLAAAFALAAILSPTDAVAVNALSKKAHIEKNIITLLEGEALINDASGLVAFKFAVAAAVTGVFSIKAATFSFFIVAFGGLAVGILAALIIIKFRIFLRKLGMEDVTLHMLIQILTPFVIFILAEKSGVSGILSVVAGGLVHSIEKSHVESSTLELKIMSENTWSVIMFILNGLVFVLLGLQIPDVTRVIYYNKELSDTVALGYVSMLTAALIAIRYIWIYLCWKPVHVIGKGSKKNIPRPKSFLLISISGVRGAVTLAAAFSIPYTLQDGKAFPQRDLIIFIAAGVILASLIIASIFLPLLSKRDVPAQTSRKINPEQAAGIRLMKAVIKAMKEETNTENRAAALSVIADCHSVISQITHNETGIGGELGGKPAEAQIWVTALKAEEKEVENMLEEGLITAEMSCKLLESLNHRERLLTGQYRYRLLIYVQFIKRVTNLLRHKHNRYRMFNARDRAVVYKVKNRMSKAAIQAVEKHINEKNSEYSLAVISRYNEAVERVASRKERIGEKFRNSKRELKFRAIQIERNEVQTLFENGEITREIANKLRKFINYSEAAILQEDDLIKNK